jgi:hypothetical protein
MAETLVDLIGIEPMTSSMPWKRAPSCATGPHTSGLQLFYCLRLRQIRQILVDSALNSAFLLEPGSPSGETYGRARPQSEVERTELAGGVCNSSHRRNPKWGSLFCSCWVDFLIRCADLLNFVTNSTCLSRIPPIFSYTNAKNEFRLILRTFAPEKGEFP